MAALTRELELLESAAGYALASTAMVTRYLLSRPTPCSAWDLAMLLGHLADSAGVLDEAISCGRIGIRGAAAGSDPALRVQERLVALLAATAAAGTADRPVAIGDRELTPGMAALTGALELTVHGWDIAAACGRARPVPPGLAAVLLATAPLLVPAGIRPGLFADPVPLPCPACPGDELVAFLGRRPPRGDSGMSSWSA